MKEIRVAALRMHSVNASDGSQLDINGATAERLIARAAQQGAVLAVLPEFALTGYNYRNSIFHAGENMNGPTVRTLVQAAKANGIWCGASFLEVEGNDFYNSFVLVSPTGTVVGKVRKARPAGYERFFTVGQDGPHVIDCELGRIGVLICYENMHAKYLEQLRSQRPDILLQVYCAPGPPEKLTLPWNEKSAKAFTTFMSSLKFHAKSLGIPAVSVNKCGQAFLQFPVGIPFKAWGSQYAELSYIISREGQVLAEMEPSADYEGSVIVANVQIGSEKLITTPETNYPMGLAYGGILDDKELFQEAKILHTAFPVIEFLGSIYYAAMYCTRKRVANKIRNNPGGRFPPSEAIQGSSCSPVWAIAGVTAGVAIASWYLLRREN